MFRLGSVALIGVAGGALVFAFIFMSMGRSQSYVTAFTKLDPQDSNAAVEALKAEGIPYQLSADGSTIKVAADRLADARLKLSAKGLPQGGAVGFELLKVGFAQYVAHFGNYDALYGTLGFVIVFLFFAYLSAQIMLFGATMTRAYSEVQAGTVTPAKPAMPRRPMPLRERVMAMVKGLFVAPEPHHAEAPPYKPAKPAGSLTDEQARTKHR